MGADLTKAWPTRQHNPIPQGGSAIMTRDRCQHFTWLTGRIFERRERAADRAKGLYLPGTKTWRPYMGEIWEQLVSIPLVCAEVEGRAFVGCGFRDRKRRRYPMRPKSKGE